MLCLHHFFKILSHVFRKLLHLAAFTCLIEKKTWEGSAAMLAVSTAVGTVTMLILTAMPWYRCLLLALAASIFGAYTELISKNGYDTVTVPLVNTAVLLALYFLPGWFSR